jgi:HK97 family phage major capsid protein
MSVHVQSAIRRFAAATTANSAYFTVDLTGGTFRINERPVIITDYAPTFSSTVPGTTGAQNILAVGAWDNYLWVQRAGMSVEQIPHLFGGSSRFPTGQRGIFAWARNGGDMVNKLGARLLQNQ